MTEKKINVVVFASGGGSNFKAIHKAILDDNLWADIVLLIASKKGVGAVEYAEKNNIPVAYYIADEYGSNENMVCELLRRFEEIKTDLIVLAGFLKLVDSRIVESYRNRIMNIHPALLPSFGGKGYYGLRVHEKVLEYGAKLSGVTVHFVDEEYDHGPVILQRAVQVEEGDTPEILQKRILNHEHDVYWRAVKLFQKKRLKVEGRIVKISGKKND